jgi:hypothetical protein
MTWSTYLAPGVQKGKGGGRDSWQGKGPQAPAQIARRLEKDSVWVIAQ